MIKKKGLLLVVSGPSGAGKGTVCKELIKRNPHFKLSVSATTRAPREGEVDGESYFFLTREKFKQMIGQGGFLEYAQIYSNFYGTPKGPVMKYLEEGSDVILEIEMQGARQVKEMYPEAVLIFVLPPSLEELKKRLTSRGTETEEEINKRLQQAKRETKVMDRYDYLIINDNVDDCVELLHNIIVSEHKRVENRLELIEKCKIEINNLLEGE